MSGKSPQKETKSTNIKSNFLSIQLGFLFRLCRKEGLKIVLWCTPKMISPKASKGGGGLYSNGNRLLLLSVVGYCDCCVCGDWGGFLFFGRVQLACDYGVYGDCNAIDLVTVMLVRCCCATWAIRVRVSQVYFMKYYMMGLLQNAQNHELERSRPVVYVEAKYFCHIKYDGDQFRYIAQREIQL